MRIAIRACLFHFVIPTYFMIYADSGTHYKKYSGNGNIFLSVPWSASSAIRCAMTCGRNQPRCVGYNYDKIEKTCELLDSAVPASSQEEDSNKTWVSGKKKIFVL